ncbi:DNA translocase FtsK 4TM domain-containing protein [Candidatus Uhrbacteria bacterium]|nr:DNA translocase FtsK 4TM domain-containing protein [Candidatus Uhrbacteria bacterium]
MTRRRKRNVFPINWSLDPETAHGIFTVILFAIAILLLLSVLMLAGSLGVAVDQAMARAFGFTRIAIPFILIVIGIHELSPERLPLKATSYVGFLLVFCSLNPFVHAAATAGELIVTTERLSRLGGAIGSIVADPFIDILGRPGAMTIFLALFLISCLLIFNTTLKNIVDFFKRILRLFYFVITFVVKPFTWLLHKRSVRIEERIRSGVEIKSLAEEKEENEEIEDTNDDEELSEDVDEEELEKIEDIKNIEKKPVAAAPSKPKKKHPMISVPLELLTRRDSKPTSGDIQHNQYLIQRTLETFGIPVDMGEVAVGPTVTQFTLKPSEGVKLIKITALHNDLALALAAHPIRIEAPIPGKSLVGIEVPNLTIATVGLREILEAKEWKERKSAISFSLGKDVSGKPWVADVSRMPHLLVAGATGSGKSVCLNTLIMSMLFANGPDDLKFIMVDPKRVELQVYNGIPHLITPVITENEKTVNALKWALREMDRRFDVLSKFGARDIASYNQRSEEKLPFIVIIIDELADLMVTAMQEVEGPIVRLAQMARAVGIHLVLATQRPSVDVITGLIKANIPARIAFAVASSMDSRTIIDQVGAEKLLGRGDMLFQTAEMATPRRIQGCFISDDEIKRVVEYLKLKYEPAEYDPTVIERSRTSGGVSLSNGLPIEEDTDPLIHDAMEEITRAGKASASLLQRRLKVGYARAARILDLLERDGFIGPADGAKPREILNVHFTKGLEQISVPEHPALLQVDREIPDIEKDDEEV